MLQLFNLSAPVVWLILLVFFAVLEGVTVSLCSVWFALGALAALLISLVIDNLWIQLLVFAVVSLVTLLLMRPLATHMFQKKGFTPTNADRILGKTGIVTEAIDNLAAKGQVKVAGQSWSARSDSGAPISAGVHVTILRIEGVRVIVRPEAETTPSDVS
ncbi:MAG: NfeD family protein [Clostridiales bacterium]|nr:NfeD family protein [Clostridiales bacterium]